LNEVIHWISYRYRKISSFLISPYWSNTTIGYNLTVQSDTLCKLIHSQYHHMHTQFVLYKQDSLYACVYPV